MDPASEPLPPAAGDKVYLIDSATWEKLRRLVSLPQIGMDATQFDYTEDSTGLRTYRYKGGGASLYHRINHYTRNIDDTVGGANGDYQSMLFVNGMLKWTWSSYDSPDPEPAVPEDVFWAESSALIEAL